ncbi:IS110 family transposase [Amycolatopsis sp. cmx-4-61]|uniref:IS110 family transposase n=1 Tax=Amycolatopsis sp. cmx-4-61 TaxID=2790937 RepID=UPI00397DADE0
MPSVDADGALVAKRRIDDSAAGFAELLAMRTDVGDTAADPIPVAIVTPRGLLVAALRRTGRRVYSINPMAVARDRERHSVSRKKSDHVDALTLANIVRTDAHAHRPLPADSELAQAVAVLSPGNPGRHLAPIPGHPGTSGRTARVLPEVSGCFRQGQRHQSRQP